MKIVRPNFNSMVRANQLMKQDPKLDKRTALIKAHKEYNNIVKDRNRLKPTEINESFKVDFEKDVMNFIKNIKLEGLFTNLNEITDDYIEKTARDMYERNGKHNPSKRPTLKSHRENSKRYFQETLNKMIRSSQMNSQNIA